MKNKKFTSLLTEEEIKKLSPEDLEEYISYLKERKATLDEVAKENSKTLDLNYRILEGYKISKDRREIEKQKEILSR